LAIPFDGRKLAWHRPGQFVVELQMSHPDLLFLLMGGHIYFDKNGDIIGVNAIRMPRNEDRKRNVLLTGKGMNFSNKIPFETKFIDPLMHKDRFKLAPAIDNKNAKFFAWLQPGEEITDTECNHLDVGPHGAFVYLFSDLLQREEKQCERNVYFNVLCHKVECCPEAENLPCNYMWPSETLRRMSTQPRVTLPRPRRSLCEERVERETHRYSVFQLEAVDEMKKEELLAPRIGFRGVKLKVLKELAEKFRKVKDEPTEKLEKELGRTPTFGDIIVNKVIKPFTQDSKESYAMHLKNTTDVKIHKCNAYICHCWLHDFCETVKAIERFEKGRPSIEFVYFCDFVSINHWTGELSDIQEYLRLMENEIEETLVVSPLEGKQHELWLMIEIAQALSCNTHLNVIQSTSQFRFLNIEIQNNLNGILRALDSVDASKAVAFEKAVGDGLLKTIKSNMGGYAKCTLSVKEFFKRWLGDQVLHVWHSLEETSDSSEETSDSFEFSIRAVKFLMKGTEAHVRQALEIVNCSLQPNRGASSVIALELRVMKTRMLCQLEELEFSLEESKLILKDASNLVGDELEAVRGKIILVLEIWAELQNKLGNQEQARRAQIHAFNLCKKWFEHSQEFIQSKKKLGIMLIKHKHWEIAKDIFEEYSRSFENQHDPDPELAMTHCRIAMCFCELGRSKHALNLIKRWLVVLSKHAPGNQQDITWALWTYQHIKNSSKDYSQHNSITQQSNRKVSTKLTTISESRPMTSLRQLNDLKISARNDIEDLSFFWDGIHDEHDCQNANLQDLYETGAPKLFDEGQKIPDQNTAEEKPGSRRNNNFSNVGTLLRSESNIQKISFRDEARRRPVYSQKYHRKSICTLRENVNVNFCKILLTEILKSGTRAEETAELFLCSLPPYIVSLLSKTPETADNVEKYYSKKNTLRERCQMQQKPICRDEEWLIENFDEKFKKSLDSLYQTNKQIGAEYWEARSMVEELRRRFHYTVKEEKQIQVEIWARAKEDIWMKRHGSVLHRIIRSEFIEIEDSIANDPLTKLILQFIRPTLPIPYFDKNETTVFQPKDLVIILPKSKPQHEIKPYRIIELHEDTVLLENRDGKIKVGITEICRAFRWQCWRCQDKPTPDLWRDVYPKKQWTSCIECGLITKKLGLTRKRYVKRKKIVDCHFGGVYFGYDSHLAEDVALKICNQKKMKEAAKSSAAENIENEIKILNGLQHKGIIILRDIKRSKAEVWLVLEWANERDLHCHVRSHFRRSASTRSRQEIKKWQSKVQRIFRDIFVAIEYLHEKDIVHRDISMENVLLFSSQSGELVPKVTDFGIAVKLEQPEQKLYKCIGKSKYWSPECILSEYNGKANDVWCLGVTLFVTLTSRHPYQRIGDNEFRNLVRRRVTPYLQWVDRLYLVTEDAQKVLSCMFVCEQFRKSCHQILKMAWCQKALPEPQVTSANSSSIRDNGRMGFKVKDSRGDCVYVT